MKLKVTANGAWPTGITELKNRPGQGLNAVALDRIGEIFGNWTYEYGSDFRIFETSHTPSSKTLPQCEDFTFDSFDPETADYPNPIALRHYSQAQLLCLFPFLQFVTLMIHGMWLDDQTMQKELPNGCFTKNPVRNPINSTVST
jgi:hypothetical protein